MLNLDQFSGIVRNILIFVGAFAAAHGMAAQTWDGISGLILAMGVFGWAAYIHVATQSLLMSFARAIIAAAGGYAMQRGWATSDQVAQWMGLAALLAPTMWTWFAHADPSAVSASAPKNVAAIALVFGAWKMAIVFAAMVGLAACTTQGALTPAARSDVAQALAIACPIGAAAAPNLPSDAKTQAAYALLASVCPPNPPPTSLAVAAVDILNAYAILKPLVK